MRLAMEFEWSFFRLLFGLSVSADTSHAAEKRGKYHLIGVGLSHAQRPPRQRLSRVLGMLNSLEVKVLSQPDGGEG